MKTGSSQGAVRAELSDLADLLEALDHHDWDRASLCNGWRVREVVAHITMPARWSAPAVLAGLARSRFRFSAFADRAAREDAHLSEAQLLTDLRSQKLADWRPPGGGTDGAVIHAVVHGLDVTVALGLDRQPPAERMRLVLQGLVGRASIKHFGVDIAGVQLQATDLDWSHGTGPVTRADAVTLALLLTGRRALPT